MVILPLGFCILIAAFIWKFERIYSYRETGAISNYFETNITQTTIWLLLVSLICWPYFIFIILDKS